MAYPWLDAYLMAKQGTEKDFKEEWQWTRYMVGGKLYAAVCQLDGKDSLITLKLPPEEGDLMRRQYPDVIPGYYMNKVHWNSIHINGSVPDEVLRDMLDTSYNLIFSGLTKKLQKEICES